MDEKIKFLDLGRQPLANGFLEKETDPEFFYNLIVNFDPRSSLVSLNKFIEPGKMFNGGYHYVSSGSETMRKHFSDAAHMINKTFMPKKVLEIGSNDGVFISHFEKSIGFAVEPCDNFATITNNIGYKTWPIFWDNNATSIVTTDGLYDVIFSANCLSHISTISDTFIAIRDSLTKYGVLIMEEPSMLSVIERGSYDQIYDEHAYIFSTLSLSFILSLFGLRIFRIDNLSIHGGSLRYYIDKEHQEVEKSVADQIYLEKQAKINNIETYNKFATRIMKSKDDLRSLLIQLKDQNKKIISYGATGKSTTIFNYCGIGPEIIDFITDSTKNKQGKFSPGMHIPIKAPEHFDNTVDFAFLGAWNFKNYILEKEGNYRGKWITHVPDVHII